jgi:hypothetical protein
MLIPHNGGAVSRKCKNGAIYIFLFFGVLDGLGILVALY